MHSYNLRRQDPDERDYKLAQVEPRELPKSVDLRIFCPPVFDQGNLGSCTAQAGVAAYMMLRGTADLFSRLFLYWKERYIEGTTDSDSGATMRSIGKALAKSGVCQEPLWPYVEEKYATTPAKPAESDASKNKIAKYIQLNGVNDIKAYISGNGQPVMIGMEVYDSFERVGNSGFVPMPNKSIEDLLGGHAILIVGYNDNLVPKVSFWRCLLNTILGQTIPEPGYFICRNSWGNWGDRGYFYLPYRFIRDGLAFDAWVIQ